MPGTPGTALVAGSYVMAGASDTVPCASVTANSTVFLQQAGVGSAVVGYVSAKTPGVSFTITYVSGNPGVTIDYLVVG
jgi:hypothetical protein